MSEFDRGASNAELAPPQVGDANEGIPPVTREPVLAFYSQEEVDAFMGKRLGAHRHAIEAYERLQPLIAQLREEYGCESDEELAAVLGEAKASGLRREGSAPTPADWAELMRQSPETDPRAVVRDPKVVRALRAGFKLSDAVKISTLLKKDAVRPRENGAARRPGSIRLDVSRMTDAQLDEIARRVKQGEQVKF